MGAEIIGADLARPVDDATLARFKDALHRYKVLAFRDQHLTKDALVAISRRWGALGEHIMQGATGEDFKEINVMSNVGADGRPNGRHTDESAKRWHTDRSWMPKPALATVLYGVEVPSRGGDTLFANAAMAYDALPDAVKSRIDGLEAVHSIEYSRRAGGGRPATAEEIRRAPPVRHPLARVHPVTGRKAIYCGCHAWKIDGMPEAEGRQLLNELIDFAAQDRFVYRHKWRKNDLVIWDNRCTFHAASDFDAVNERRIMHRIIIE
jgi:taurine dioxygenase